MTQDSDVEDGGSIEEDDHNQIDISELALVRYS